MPSLKTNFIYNFILTGGNHLMAFAVFPYISRVLGPENVGIVNFVDSTIDYFIMLSTMGMMSVGVREIASAKNNPERLSNAFSGLFFVNLLFTILSLLALGATYIFLPALSEYPEMVFIGVIKLIFKFLLIEWFFCGLEDFKYISIRSLIIKFIYVIGVFIWVRQASDYEKYYILLVGIQVAGAIANWEYGRKKIKFVFNRSSCKSYIRPFIYLGLYSLCIGMYNTFNVMFLGIATNETEVGYYTTALKMFAVIIAFYYAFTGVALPRMSALLSEKNIDEFINLIHRTTNTLIALSIPIIISGICLAPQIIFIIGGPKFNGSIIPMILIFPLLIIIGYNKILIEQIMMPYKKDKILMRNAAISALITIVLNILLARPLGAIGTAIVWIGAEITLLILSMKAVVNLLPIKFPVYDLIKQVIIYIPMGVSLWYMGHIFNNNYIHFATGVLFATIYFIIIQYKYIKTPEVNNMIKKFIPIKSLRQ
ncbi:flippase [Muribaculum sp.]|uniref:flippase n=1 Tax=Muribaculum sp. TaxID=1918611 RepID=UPI002631D44F|nr:flippase [Muribaculum sp.]